MPIDTATQIEEEKERERKLFTREREILLPISYSVWTELTWPGESDDRRRLRAIYSITHAEPIAQDGLAATRQQGDSRNGSGITNNRVWLLQEIN